MAIAIQEYLGFEASNTDSGMKTSKLNIKESLVQEDPMCPNSLMADIEGIHVGPTRNYTWYTKEALVSSKPTWTSPYLRPVIMHHNESDGKIIGRVRHVDYSEINTKSGTGALIFTANIPDKEGKEQIKDGRLKTVSIGVIVHDATCTICNHNIAQNGECEHERGNSYDGEICYWKIHKMEAKELSYVIVPSDIFAQNIKIYEAKNINVQESKQEGVLNLSEAKKELEQKEGSVVDETVKTEEVKVANVEENKLMNENKELKEEVETLKSQIVELKKGDSTAVSNIEAIQAELEEANKQLGLVRDELTVSKAETVKEKQLKESAEEEIFTHQKSIKESLIKEVITLRESLGKESKEEDFSGRNMDSLKDSIKDLKEELTVGVKNITIPKNPSLSIEENTSNNVDKEISNSNISLAEELQGIFSGIVGSKIL